MTQLNEKTVQESMDVHAKNISCAFLKWVDKEDYKSGALSKYYYKWNGMYVVDTTPYTVEQLFDKFIQSL